jgi:hypothetical protein
MVHISDIKTGKSICVAYFGSVSRYGIIFVATLPTVGRYSRYARAKIIGFSDFF